MTKDSFRLVAYGFVKKDYADDYKDGKLSIEVSGKKYKIEGSKPLEKIDSIKKLQTELGEDKVNPALEKIADHENYEAANNQFILSEYPNPLNTYGCSLESWHQSIEHYYFWCLNFLGDIGFPIIDKITDVFTASEHSSFYGAAGQRLGLAQDKVAGYLASIGKMIKDLFQLVRELRWIDERLTIYFGAMGLDNEGKPLKNADGSDKGPIRGDEIALKGLWVDLVDGVVGGQRTGSNIITMSQQVGFNSLPELFFKVHPRNREELEKVVEDQAGEQNLQVRDQLKRKLSQYLAWKYATFDEMKQRRKFTIDYLYQHYHVIKMYMNWVKPYLRHVERLSLEQDLLKNPRLVAAFESSLVEIEVLARKRPDDMSSQNICILLSFEYSTKPQMQYQTEGYHKGPIHVGTTRIRWRSYAWSDEQIKNYLAMKDKQDFELLKSLDASLASAMDQLGNDVFKYIEEAKSGKKKEEPPKSEPLNLLEPFIYVGKGFMDVVSALIPSLPKGKGGGGGDKKEDPKVVSAKMMCFLHYNVFKKANGLLSW